MLFPATENKTKAAVVRDSLSDLRLISDLKVQVETLRVFNLFHLYGELPLK